MTTLLKELRRLSPAEKILLAEELWNSVLDAGAPPAVTEAQKAELDRRLAAHREKPVGSSWPKVRARLQAKR